MILQQNIHESKCFINPQYRHRAIMEKMQSFLSRKQQTKTLLLTFYNYIIQCLNIYDVFLRKLTEDAQRQLQGGSFASSKCRQVRRYFTKLVEMCHLYLDYNFNNLKEISDLSCVGLCKTEQKMNQKYQFFTTAKVDYLRSEHSYRNSYRQLEKKCDVLKKKLNLLNKYQKPLKFYDQTDITNYLNQLEKYYYQCQSMEKDTKIQEDLLKQKENWLKSILDEIADKCVGLVKDSMQKIVKVCDIMMQINGLARDGRISNGEQLFDDGLDEMKRYEQIYSKNNANSNSFMQNFQDFFSQNKVIFDQFKCNQLLLIDERCNLVKEKQIKDITQVIKQRKSFIQSLKRHRDMFMDLQKNINQAKKKFIASQTFNNNIENFRRQFQQCFGKNIFEIEQLAILILQNLNQSIQQFSNMIKSKNIYLFESILETEQKEMERFEKNTNQILKQHQNLIKRNSFENQSENAEKSKKYCLNIFEQFRMLFRETSNAREERDQTFNKIVAQFNIFLYSTLPNSHQQLLKKEYNRYEIFRNIIPAHEVMEIMKNDQTYDVLFHDIRNTSEAFLFQSPIPFKNYEKIRKILVDKSSLFKDKAEKMESLQKQFCCWTPRKKKRNNNKQYQCSIEKQGKWITGILTINNKALYFIGQKYFFQKTISLYIPFSQIKEQPSIEQKQKIVKMQTKMGSIQLQSESINIIYQHLKNQLSTADIYPEENSPFIRSESRKRLSLVPLSSNNRKSVKMYQFVLPKEKQGSVVDTTVNEANYQVANRILKKLQQLPKFFSDIFQVIQKDSFKNRIDYFYEKQFFKFQLHQQRTLQSSIFANDEDESRILIKFNWKIIPKCENALSFLHNQKVIIILRNDQAYIKIFQSPRNSWEKYISKIFYDEVVYMNENLKEDIHHESHRKCRVQYFLNNIEDQGGNKLQQNIQQDIFDVVPFTTGKISNIGSSVALRNNSNRSLLS